MPLFNKNLRLPATHYLGRQAYFVTICTEERADFFSREETGRWVVDELVSGAASANFLLHAWCAMPDHVHFVAEGRNDSCHLVKFVDGLKQRTAYAFSRSEKKRLWQRRYYDHVLRPNDAIEDVARYLWWNPVRKGLCARPQDYPLSGSQAIDWMKRAAAATGWVPPWKAGDGEKQAGKEG